MIKLKDLLIEQNNKVLPGRIVLVTTDSGTAPNKNSFARFQTKNGTVQGDSSDSETKAIRSEGSAFSKKFSFVEKTRPEQDYLKIGNIVINSQTDIVRFTKSSNKAMFQPVEASGNGVYLLSRLLEAWDTYPIRSAPDSIILKMNATRAGIQMVEFNPSLQRDTRINAGPILCGYCFVQAGLATPEFLQRRQFAIDPDIKYNNPVNSAYSFFPSLKDDALRKNSEMISLGNDLQSLVDSFVSKYKGKKMVPTDYARRKTFWPTPWRDEATNDLVAMSKTLSNTFKSRHKMFISLKLQEFGVDPEEGNVLDAKIDKYWSLAGVYPKIVTSLFGEPKKGGGGGTSKGVAAGGQTTSSGGSGKM